MTTEPENKPVTILGEAVKDSPQADNKVDTKSTSKAAAEKSGGGIGRFFIILLLLIIVLGMAGGAYFAWQYWQQDQQFKKTYSQTMAQQQQQLQQINSEVGATKAKAEQAVNADATGKLEASMLAIQQRLDSQNKRLISLSSTSREDWLLAEAEYLLRLANQRLLTERATTGAIGLLVTADAILRDMDDVDLFPIRQTIGNNLAALKISAKVDRDGLFLRIAGLAAQIEKLPTVPKRIPMKDRNVAVEAPVLPEEVSWSHRIGAWGTALWQYLGHFIEFRKNEPVNALLPPEAQAYVKLNLRFMLERAQLAMLREETVIYQASLQQARHWLQTQFPPSSQIRAFISEIDELEQEAVAAELPDISSSLEQLRVYIERLHKIKSSQPQAKPQLSAKEA